MHDEIDLRRDGGVTGYVSVLTMDSGKHLLGIGGGDEAGGWQNRHLAGIAIPADVQVSLARGPVAATDADPGSAGRE